ncbi:hypothetical protein [Streptomyces cellulosae]|uniref:DUF1330 domain-containing protein n=1 Tax=Streptomyces cellulosae TaxID=1968 RepID=A0ABW7YFQ4_STRCE
MSAYVVMLSKRVSDPAEPARYAGSALAGHPETLLVAYGAIETLEGAVVC